jgi:hypothetical protein
VPDTGGRWRDHDCANATFIYFLIEYDCAPAPA